MKCIVYIKKFRKKRHLTEKSSGRPAKLSRPQGRPRLDDSGVKAKNFCKQKKNTWKNSSKKLHFRSRFLRMEAKSKEFHRSRGLTFPTQSIYRKFLLKQPMDLPFDQYRFLVTLQISVNNFQKVSFGQEGFMSGNKLLWRANIAGHEPGHHFNEKF